MQVGGFAKRTGLYPHNYFLPSVYRSQCIALGNSDPHACCNRKVYLADKENFIQRRRKCTGRASLYVRLLILMCLKKSWNNYVNFPRVLRRSEDLPRLFGKVWHANDRGKGHTITPLLFIMICQFFCKSCVVVTWWRNTPLSSDS